MASVFHVIMMHLIGHCGRGAGVGWSNILQSTGGWGGGTPCNPLYLLFLCHSVGEKLCVLLVPVYMFYFKHFKLNILSPQEGKRSCRQIILFIYFHNCCETEPWLFTGGDLGVEEN